MSLTKHQEGEFVLTKMARILLSWALRTLRSWTLRVTKGRPRYPSRTRNKERKIESKLLISNSLGSRLMFLTRKKLISLNFLSSTRWLIIKIQEIIRTKVVLYHKVITKTFKICLICHQSNILHLQQVNKAILKLKDNLISLSKINNLIPSKSRKFHQEQLNLKSSNQQQLTLCPRLLKP